MNSLDFEVDDWIVTVTVSSDADSRTIEEARHRGVPLTGDYSTRRDVPRIPHVQHHLHIFKRGNEICVITQDGKGLHGSQGYQVPNKVADALRQKFPTWHIPDNNILECISRVQYVTETFARE